MPMPTDGGSAGSSPSVQNVHPMQQVLAVQNGWAQHMNRASRSGTLGNGESAASAAAHDAAPGAGRPRAKFEDDREAWLAGVLEDQRLISERQIRNQHEMLRLHFDAALQACLGPAAQSLGGSRAPQGVHRDWSPEMWDGSLDGSHNSRENSSSSTSAARLYDPSIGTHGWCDPSIATNGYSSPFLSASGIGGDDVRVNITTEQQSGAAVRGRSPGPRPAQKSQQASGAAAGDAGPSPSRAGPAGGGARGRGEEQVEQEDKEQEGKEKEREQKKESAKLDDKLGKLNDADRMKMSATLSHGTTQFNVSEDSEAEERQPSWLEWSMGMPLDILAVFLIVVNTFFMMAHSMWLGYEIRVQLGMEAPGEWQSAAGVFKVSEVVFTIFFFCELVCRLVWNGLVFLKDPLNLIDAIVVILTTLDTLVFSQLDFKAGISAIRLIRIVKLFKTFRFAKAMKMVAPLRILIRTIAASILSLFWSMCILFMFMLVSAILTAQTVQQFIQDDANDMEMRLWCEHHYGNVMKALWTMFLITMSGGWPNWVTPLVHEISIVYALFFGIYVTLVVFAVIRVITALFLKETLAQAAKDADEMYKDKAKTRQKTLKQLEFVFEKMDKNKDGALTESEFNNSLSNQKVVKMFLQLEMEPGELQGVFHLLDDGSGEVELQEFLEGIMKMKGTTRSTDLLILQHDNRKMMQAVELLEAHMMSAVGGLDKHLDIIQKMEEKVSKSLLPQHQAAALRDAAP